MKIRQRFSSIELGQSLTETALALPILLVLIIGVFELGRFVLIFSTVNNASREAARYGASTGAAVGLLPNYLDCDAIRQQARETALLAGLTDAEIQIAYDTPVSGTMQVYADCDSAPDPDSIVLGDRIVITITKEIDPILPILPFPSFKPTFVTARTILKGIVIGPVECSDTLDNDGDGQTDYPNDPGCSGPDDTTEAFCYRLALFTNPIDAGNTSESPESNCANRYIEYTLVSLGASPAVGYAFDNWSGDGAGITPTLSVNMDSDKEIIANFRLLTSNLGVTKNDTPDPVASQKPISYTITVSNPYTDTAHNIVISDTLPVGVDYQGVWSSSDSDGVCIETVVDAGIECTLPELAAGSVATFGIEVIAPIANFGPEIITNTVSVDAFEFDPDMSDNMAIATTQVLPRAELSIISKEDSTDPVDAGEIFEYTITVLNSGPSVATGVIVEDVLPPGMQLIANGQCSAPDPDLRNVTCQVGQIAAGDTAAVTFSVYAPNSGGLVSNDAIVSGNELEDNPGDNTSDPEDTDILSHANLRIVKTGPLGVVTSDITVNRDEPFNYLLLVENNGPSTANNVVVVDTLPSGMVFNEDNYINPSGGICQLLPGNQVSCNLGNMLSGAGWTVSLNVTPTLEGDFTNYASVDSDTDDRNTSNNDYDLLTHVVVDVDLSITKSSEPITTSLGSLVTYTIVARNDGLSDATTLRITDTLPLNFEYVGIDGPNDWICAFDLSQQVTCEPVAGTYRMETGTEIAFTVVASATTVGRQTNTVTIASNEDRATASAVTDVIDVDLSVGIDAPLTSMFGSPYTYTISLTNDGSQEATNVTLASQLDSDVSFGLVAIKESGLGVSWTCSYDSSTRQVICDAATFPSGITAVIGITVIPTTATTITNEAFVVADESPYDTDPSNDADIRYTIVNPSLDLSVSIGGPLTATVDSDVMYTVTLTNSGPSDATGVSLTVTVESSLIISDAYDLSGVGWSCSNNDAVAVCNNVGMAAETQASFAIWVVPTASGSPAISATVLSNESPYDTIPSNDSKLWEITVE